MDVKYLHGGVSTSPVDKHSCGHQHQRLAREAVDRARTARHDDGEKALCRRDGPGRRFGDIDCFFINEARLPMSRLGSTAGGREGLSVVDALGAVVTVMPWVPSRDASEEFFLEGFV